MSEPMSSVEIEDVLSSIRRLVSEDLRPQHRPQTPASPAPASGAASGADRLILTPALRVVGNEPAGAAPAPQPGAELATPVAELPETFGDAEAEDAAGLVPEPVPEAMSEAMSEATADPAWWSDEVAVADMASPADPAWSDEPAQSTEPAQLDEPDAASVIEDVVAGLSQQDYDASWEPETGDPMDDHPALHWADGAWAEPAPRMPAFDRIDEAEEAELAAREPVAEPVPAWGEGDWDAPGAAEDAPMQAASFADPLSVPDPVSDPASDPAPTDAAMADRAEAEAIAAIAAMEVVDDLEQATMARLAEEAADAEAAVGLFDAEDGVIDEEALREVVRDIIRDELQGSLGERITRNVRKLVRAEVARALAARDFD